MAKKMHGMNEVSFSRAVKEVKFGAWTLDPKRQTISDGDAIRELEPLLFKILSYLVINNEQIITRKDLIDDVWCQHYVDDNAINRAVSELRKVLKSEKQKGLVVKTHYRKGYSFFLEPQYIFHEEEKETLVSPPVEEFTNDVPPLKPANQTNKVKLVASLSILLAILVAFIYLQSPIPKTSPSPEVKEQDYEMQLLTWNNEQQYNGLIIHPNEQFIAFMQSKQGSKESRVVIKELATAKEVRFGHAGELLYPIGWSRNGDKLLYRRNRADNQCEVWAADIASPEGQGVEYLFDCDKRLYRAAQLNNGDIAYTKYHYRNRDELSVIMILNLETGDEFQVSSPNLNSFGDKLLHYDPVSNKLFFERVQYGHSELFVSDPEGTEQTKLAVVKNRVWVANYDPYTSLFSWFDSQKQQVYSLSLEDNAQKSTLKPTNVDNFLIAYMMKNSNLLAITNPYEQDLYQLSAESNKLTPFANSDKAEFSVASSNNLTAHLSGRDKLVIGDTSRRSQVSLPNDTYKNIDISSELGEVLLLGDNRIDIYEIENKSFTSLLEFQSPLLFASYIDAHHIGYILKDSETGEHQAFIYHLESKRQTRLAIPESTWFDKISDTVIVYKPLKEKLVFFDLENSEVVTERDIAKSKGKHSFTVMNGHVYHSDGMFIYRIPSMGSDSDKEVVFTLDEAGHINNIEATKSKGVTLIEIVSSKSNYLIQANKL
ncbi:hypothetical protein CWB72_16255 [Pseudoalteromonas phenolica]|uniref:winged helix-turn-helix domain-containing protein n=1 Tax=Pseudoalteromonas phenolica TaxID=161398 RepID=UPI00110A335E|nr:winged helix-turn-helix domain-containing protein [Pseudoalteromonas phenolica]TMN87284.1 hypothetical protein CWB72_16255 [Pseudoalteromonas phenolica]